MWKFLSNSFDSHQKTFHMPFMYPWKDIYIDIWFHKACFFSASTISCRKECFSAWNSKIFNFRGSDPLLFAQHWVAIRKIDRFSCFFQKLKTRFIGLWNQFENYIICCNNHSFSTLPKSQSTDLRWWFTSQKQRRVRFRQGSAQNWKGELKEDRKNPFEK